MDEETVEELRAQRDQLAAALTAALAQLDRIGASAAFPVTADGTGPLPSVPSRAGHRVPKEARWLKAVPAVVLVGWHTARHAHWAAKTAATVLAAGVVTTAAVVPATAPLHGVLAAPAVQVPAVGPYAASPMSSPSQPVPLRLAGAVTRPGLLTAISAGTAPDAGFVPAPPASSPSDSSQPSSQTADPSPSSDPPSPADTWQVDSPQPGQWHDSVPGGWRHRQPDSPSPTDSGASPADTSTPDAPVASPAADTPTATDTPTTAPS